MRNPSPWSHTDKGELKLLTKYPFNNLHENQKQTNPPNFENKNPLNFLIQFKNPIMSIIRYMNDYKYKSV